MGRQGGGRVELAVKGMTCGHCAESVRKALAACPGVRAADVDLASGLAWAAGEEVDAGALVEALEKAGFAAGPLNEGGGG